MKTLTLDEWIPESYQIKVIGKLHTEGKDRFIITHNKGVGVTTAMLHYIMDKMRFKKGYKALLIKGNGGDIVEFGENVRRAFVGEVSVDEFHYFALKNGSSLNWDGCSGEDDKYDIIYCDGKPDGTMWIDGKLYQTFLKPGGKLVVTRTPHYGEFHPSPIEYWTDVEHDVFVSDKDTMEIFAPWWMASWNNKEGVKLFKSGRLDATCYNYGDIVKYLNAGYHMDIYGCNENYVNDGWVSNNVNKRKDGKSIFTNPMDVIEFGTARYEDWLRTRAYKGVNWAMGIDSLKEEFRRLEKERTTFVGCENQGHGRVNDYFYSKVIEQIEKDIEECKKEIALAEAMDKDKEAYEKLDIDGFVGSKNFELSKILSSKDMIDAMNNSESSDFDESVIACFINELRKLGYSNDEICERMGDNATYAKMKDKLAELHSIVDRSDFAEDKCIISPEMEREINKEVLNVVNDWVHDVKTDNEPLKENDGDSKNDSESIYAEPESGAEDDDVIDDEKTVFVVDDATDDNVNRPFVMTADTGGVFYGDYVTSVSADYNAHELYVEIEDICYDVIPDLLEYWENLYDGTVEPTEEDIIVRDNGLTKAFETFKDCEIINIELSPYEDGEIKARKAILTYSYDRSVIEPLTKYLDRVRID